jgi:polyisoprenoid-binding protein YceI
MLKKVIIGFVALGVIGAVGLFILDRTIFAPTEVSSAVPVAPTLAAPTGAPRPLTLATSQPSASPQPSAPGNTTASQLYRIDATQSEVHYEVAETFFQENNRIATAIGRTKGVAGDIAIDFNQPSNSQLGDIVIDIRQFISDQSRRDNYIRRNGLESARYPTATFKTKSIEGLPAKVNIGDEVTFTINGDLTVRETTKPVSWQVTLKLEQNRLSGSASTQIKMSDFGVGPIRIPLLATEDDVKLVFDFVAAQVEA